MDPLQDLLACVRTGTDRLRIGHPCFSSFPGAQTLRCPKLASWPPWSTVDGPR